MDLPSLSVGLDQVAPSGAGLSTERRVALQTSLLLLKSAEKFARVTYWGKICGVSADYFVAQGYNDLSDPFTCKNFYRYGMACTGWVLRGWRGSRCEAVTLPGWLGCMREKQLLWGDDTRSLAQESIKIAKETSLFG